MNGSNKRRWNGEPLVLFVEGYSDLRFYAEMMEHLGKHKDCFIKDIGGKGRGKLKDEATLLLTPVNLSTITAVAVLLDADDSADAALRLAQGALCQFVGIPKERVWVPAKSEKTRFGIFIVGDQDHKGEIETVAWNAWKNADKNKPQTDCIERYIQCVEAAGAQVQSRDKVRVGTMLAVHSEDDPRLGPGTQKRVFDLDASEFEPLRLFLGAM